MGPTEKREPQKRSNFGAGGRYIINGMEVRARQEAESVAAVPKVLRYIQEHLDDCLSASELCDVACCSQHHFHRVFRATVGESMMDHVRRLRLEKATFRLRSSRDSIASIGLDAGYGAQEAFTRVFQSYFGLAPRMFRCTHAAYYLPAVSGIHYSPSGFSPLRKAVEPELLDDTGLCPMHRDCPVDYEEQMARFLSLVSGFPFFSELPSVDGLLHGTRENPMSNTLTDIDKELDDLWREVEAAKQKLVEARKRRPKEPVQDYLFKDADGSEIKLSELFGDKSDLILVHNMGTGCIYCTMWADGFTGLVPHLSDRAAFVLTSPDKPEVQKKFAAKRNWNFKMVSAAENTFPKDMGFWAEDGPHPGPWPGISTFRKAEDGSITRIAKTFLGPNDDFCALWPMLDMLAEGPNGWEPKYSYEEKP